jgi:hypothetical protein
LKHDLEVDADGGVAANACFVSGAAFTNFHISLCTYEKMAENDASGGLFFGTLSTTPQPARLAALNFF